MKELVIPPAALRDPRSVEVLRAWVAESALWCSLKLGFYQGAAPFYEARAWGITLADVVKHVADGLQIEGLDRADVIREIRAAFLNELDKPTSETSGSYV